MQQQQDKVKSPFDTASKQDVASQDFLFQPDYFHGELNASEDSLLSGRNLRCCSSL